MFTFATMRKYRPDFLLHSGDTVYADGPIKPEVALADGKVWKNFTIPEKAKVAETLDEFRAAHKYNFSTTICAPSTRSADLRAVGRPRGDQQLVGCRSSCPRLQGARHQSAGRARGARLPRNVSDAREHRGAGPGLPHAHYGPHLDVFMLDERSYRGPNGPNQQTTTAPTLFPRPGPAAWLKARAAQFARHLEGDRSDMPLSIIVYDDAPNKKGSEAFAQGDGPPRGRELEIADCCASSRTRRSSTPCG
jgi:alkaline phosphatase D